MGAYICPARSILRNDGRAGTFFKSPNVSAARLRRIGKDEFDKVGLADRCEVSGKTQNRRAALRAMPVKN